MKRDFEEYYQLPWTVIETKNGAFMVPNTETLTTEHWFKRSLKDGLIETFSTNAFPPRVAALKHAVLCVNLMPEAESIIGAVLEFVKRCEEEGIQIVGTAIKGNEPVGMIDVGDILKDRCQMFLDKLNREEWA